MGNFVVIPNDISSINILLDKEIRGLIIGVRDLSIYPFELEVDKIIDIANTTDKEINEENVTKILEAAGVDVDEARVKALIAALEDVDIDEAIETSAIAAAPVAAAPAAAPAEEEEEEEEEESEEEAEEEAAAGLGALFG